MDRLTLRIENRSDAAGDLPEDISVVGQGLSIGRKKDNDWSLPDTTRFISGRHVRVLFAEGNYLLEDMSTNGTFLNGTTTKVEGQHKLEHGDKIRIGSYVVAVEIVTEERATPTITGAQGVQAPPTAGHTNQRQTAPGVQRHSAPGVQTNVSAPPTFSQGAQTPDFSRFQTGVTGATGVQRPGSGISMPPTAAGRAPANPIPDDFDDDLLGLTGADADPVAAAPEPTPAPPAAAPPSPSPTPDPSAPTPSTPAQVNATQASEVTPFSEAPMTPPYVSAERVSPSPERTSPFSPMDPTAAPVVLPDPVETPAVPVVERTDLTPRGLGERFAETAVPRPAPVAADPPPVAEAAPAPAPTPAPAPEPAAPPPPPEPATNALLEGFLEGAGIEEAEQLGFDLHELGVMLGKCARLGTQEMMYMLQDRSAVKLFVANDDRTMRIASGNNPMKFMADPDEAFLALFVQPRDGYQTGPDGFDNALADIRQHQKAMMAAIQPALADMLEGLAPKEIEKDAGGGRLGGGARKAWEEYEKRWDARAAQGENGMLDAFIDAFSRRYTQALDSL